MPLLVVVSVEKKSSLKEHFSKFLEELVTDCMMSKQIIMLAIELTVKKIGGAVSILIMIKLSLISPEHFSISIHVFQTSPILSMNCVCRVTQKKIEYAY